MLKEVFERRFGILLIAILLLQFCAGLWHISFPFFDGRLHYNWGPPFWLMHAKAINDVGLLHTYFGLADYSSHPELIGPVIAIWTQIVGYSEASIRILSLSLTVLATLFLTLSMRRFLDARRALAFAMLFAALPLIYIYGKKLDQEALVLIFLGLEFWGLSIVEKSERFGLTLLTLGAFGMVQSDWSGIVFSGFFVASVPMIWDRRQHKRLIVKVVGAIIAGAGVGVVLYLIQSYLQMSSHGLAAFVNGYFQQWKYRAGLTEDFVWTKWVSAQVGHLSSNYSILLSITAMISLVAVVSRKILPQDIRARRVAIMGLVIFCAQIVYMLIVPQASGIHIYFQYFLSIPFAIGIILGIDFIAGAFIVSDKQKPWLLVFGIIFLATASFSALQYHKLLFGSSGSDVSDIELIKSLRTVLTDQSIIAIDTNPDGLAWYQNPNIDYYLGRSIKTYLLDDGFPFADYQIVPRMYVDEFLSQINTMHGLGQNVKASSERCSTNLCILHLVRSGR